MLSAKDLRLRRMTDILRRSWTMDTPMRAMGASILT